MYGCQSKIFFSFSICLQSVSVFKPHVYNDSFLFFVCDESYLLYLTDIQGIKTHFREPQISSHKLQYKKQQLIQLKTKMKRDYIKLGCTT